MTDHETGGRNRGAAHADIEALRAAQYRATDAESACKALAQDRSDLRARVAELEALLRRCRGLILEDSCLAWEIAAALDPELTRMRNATQDLL